MLPYLFRNFATTRTTQIIAAALMSAETRGTLIPLGLSLQHQLVGFRQRPLGYRFKMLSAAVLTMSGKTTTMTLRSKSKILVINRPQECGSSSHNGASKMRLQK